MAALLQTLRYVAPYEGGTDYTFERRFKSALSLMFHRYSVAFVGFVHLVIFLCALLDPLCRESDYVSERQGQLPALVIGMDLILSAYSTAALTLSYPSWA